MIQINDKSACCGCSACVQTCPKQCISIKEDGQGFGYPVVDEKHCVNCHLCERVCPCLNQNEPKNPLKVYAAINPNINIRKKSSSGGIFTMLAESVLAEGGVVFGARFDDKWEVKHCYIEKPEEIEAFRGSKYVQSYIGDTYKEAKAFLNSGRKVLFSGTPCQIAGLKHYLKKDYLNLITIDIACHGVPSPKIWAAYIEVIRHGLSNPTSQNYKLLNELKFKVYYDNKNNILLLESKPSENDYMRSFILGLTLRPSCYKCQCKNFRSHSDITIADFWGVEKVLPDFDDGRGTSLAIINSNRGLIIFEKLDLRCQETNNTSLAFNPALTRSVVLSNYRDLCFQNFGDGKLINNIRKSICYFQNERSSYLKIFLRPFLSRIKKIKFRTIEECNSELMAIKSPTALIDIYNQNSFDSIIGINFRDKTYGWNNYVFSIKIKLKKNIQ